MIRTALALMLLGGSLLAQGIPSPGSGQPAGAQPGGVPILPVNNPKAAFEKLPPGLQAHLTAWEKKTQSLQNLYTECEREVSDVIRNKKVKYAGAIRCMKPNLAYLRIDNAAKKEDFVAYICDGKIVHEYSGLDKVVVQHKIPAGGKGNVGDNLLLEFMSGAMTAADIAARFDLKLMKEDQYYVYIDVKPLLPKDQQEFESLILVLFSGQVKGMEYLPAKVRMTKDGNKFVEEWTFKNPIQNATNIKETDFQYIAPPRDWKTQQSEPQPKVSRP